MALMTRELKASYAFVERNFNLTKRYWGWEIAWLVYSVAGALAVSLIGVSEGDPRLLMTLVIGTIFWSYLSIVFEFIAEAVQWERWEGTLEYTFMAPVRRYAQLLGAAAYAVIFGLVHTMFVLLVLWLFFSLDLSNANFATAAAFTLLGTVSFAGIGIAASILPLMYVERGAQMVFVIQSVLLLVSGVYYTVDVLPGWMQAVSAFSPATYVLDGVRAGLIDGVGMGDLLHDVWPLLLMGVVLIPAGLWAFGVAERYAKRTGKLKRVG
jgi:ABC-2 type transport system permease protein